MKSPARNYPALIASITVRGAEKAIEFYAKAFGATERYRLTNAGSGRIGHAELEVNGSMIMLADEDPDWNRAPQTLGGTAVKFILMVEDADTAFDQAIAAGATPLIPVGDQFHGYRMGTVKDPFGHEWMLQHLIEEVSPGEMQRRWDAMLEDSQPF